MGKKMDLSTQRAIEALRQISRDALEIASTLAKTTNNDLRNFAARLGDAADLLSSYADDLDNEVVQPSLKEAPRR
jgi:hypothetical protein